VTLPAGPANPNPLTLAAVNADREEHGDSKTMQQNSMIRELRELPERRALFA
jgi:hypothetical protein